MMQEEQLTGLILRGIGIWEGLLDEIFNIVMFYMRPKPSLCRGENKPFKVDWEDISLAISMLVAMTQRAP